MLSWSFTLQASRGKHAMPERRRQLVLHQPSLHRKPRVAVLIDAENVSCKLLERAMAVAQKSGRVVMKRAYGNASLVHAPRWRDELARWGFETVLCTGFVAGKNSADIALVVEAMRALAGRAIDTFVIVSGDSDFAPLVRELRANGRFVHGVGSPSTPLGYRKLCDEFVEVDVVKDLQAKTRVKKAKAKKAKAGQPRGDRLPIDDELIRITREAMQQLSPTNEWCEPSRICTQIRKRVPDFTLKKYGCKSLASFAKKTGVLEVKNTNGGRRFRLVA